MDSIEAARAIMEGPYKDTVFVGNDKSALNLEYSTSLPRGRGGRVERQERERELEKEGHMDWLCSMCGAVNFARYNAVACRCSKLIAFGIYLCM